MDKLNALETVKMNGVMLQTMPEFANDIDVVLEAVRNNGPSLKYASDAMKNNKEVVMAAALKNANALEYASDKIKNDKDFILSLIKQTPNVMEAVIPNVSKKLKRNEEVIIAAEIYAILSGQRFHHYPHEQADDKLKNDPNFSEKIGKISKELKDMLEEIAGKEKNKEKVQGIDQEIGQ